MVPLSLDRPPRICPLPDGRRLSFDLSGPEDGVPVYMFHGLPGSRYQRPPDDAPLHELGVCFVSIDRPGIGGSTFQPNRRLLDWPADVAALADHLGHDTFRVIGVSGGGPYVAACARELPDRLVRGGIISGLGPVTEPETRRMLAWRNRQVLHLAHRAPWVMWPWFTFLRTLVGTAPEAAIGTYTLMLPDDDRQILRRPELSGIIRADVREAGRQGLAGFMLDAAILGSPWGFHPSEIRAPLDIWHGDADSIVPFSMGQYMARHVPEAEFIHVPGRAHYMLLDLFKETLRKLLN